MVPGATLPGATLLGATLLGAMVLGAMVLAATVLGPADRKRRAPAAGRAVMGRGVTVGRGATGRAVMAPGAALVVMGRGVAARGVRAAGRVALERTGGDRVRIVAGKHRGARLVAPEGLEIRPTSERAREALFSILEGGRFPLTLRGARVLDLFAGTGALGLEALSRGASQIVFVENGAVALEALRSNIAKLRAAGMVHVRETDATRFLERTTTPADLVLMDPPYGSGLWVEALDTIGRGGWIGADTVIAVEVGKKESVAAPPGYNLAGGRRYGAARLILLQKQAA